MGAWLLRLAGLALSKDVTSSSRPEFVLQVPHVAPFSPTPSAAGHT